MNDIGNLSIKGLSEDSRRVQPGDLFFALPGFTVDGNRFVTEAIERGAAAVLMHASSPALTHAEFLNSETQDPKNSNSKNQDTKISNAKNLDSNVLSNIPIIHYSDLKNSVGYIADMFYSMPSAAMKVIGITGTNGKTSCSHFIAQLMAELGSTCGVIGTLGVGFLQNLQYSQGMTNEEATSTHKALAKIYQEGGVAVAMEVTSHALTQARVNGVRFHTAIFTNLTRDHLDYHDSMEDYFAAKKRLFVDYESKFKIINLDDAYGRILWQEIQENSNKEKMKTVFGYMTRYKTQTKSSDLNISSKNLSEQILYTEDLVLDEKGISATLHSPWGSGTIHCPLLGSFNLSNLLAAIAALCVQDFNLEKILKVIPKLKTVNGRMLRLGGGSENPLVVVDFAHSPDALANVLQALTAHCKGALWCVFGCGGDRDTGKRPLMAKVTETFCDHIVVTQDNPRTEDPLKIMQDIIAGFATQKSVHIEPDRRAAIHFAILSAAPEDIVVIAGKGHEIHQIIGHEKIPFSDQIVASEALNKRDSRN